MPRLGSGHSATISQPFCLLRGKGLWPLWPNKLPNGIELQLLNGCDPESKLVPGTMKEGLC